ncbi:hypothetical protein [Yersinia sp. 2541 StPb PI]|uniref:hypothetical protein n=1 Tax=Yersinia sp. 2541 StPb PI TaxID=3117407 RepID=UPI003FA4840A
MLISKKSLLVLLYLCVAFSLMLFFVSFIFQVLGYWIGDGDGDQMLGYLKDNFHKALKTSSVGVGCAYWFFYYRKI